MLKSLIICVVRLVTLKVVLPIISVKQINKNEDCSHQSDFRKNQKRLDDNNI